MILLDTPLSGLNGLCLQDFWQLPVTKDFAQPEYYIGQTVLHVMKVKGGEILHPVQIIGALWTGLDWEYAVSLTEKHPEFEEEDCEWMLLNDWQLEAM